MRGNLGMTWKRVDSSETIRGWTGDATIRGRWKSNDAAGPVVCSARLAEPLAPAGEPQPDPRQDPGGEAYPEILVQGVDQPADLLGVQASAPQVRVDRGGCERIGDRHLPENGQGVQSVSFLRRLGVAGRRALRGWLGAGPLDEPREAQLTGGPVQLRCRDNLHGRGSAVTRFGKEREYPSFPLVRSLGSGHRDPGAEESLLAREFLSCSIGSRSWKGA